jgi:disulfide bond formation protein DsbB
MGFTQPLVTFLSALTIVGQAIVVVLAVLALQRKVPAFVARNSLLLMFIVSLAATGGSLFFSDVAGWTPCKLCWFQRIFMYPQTILLALALWKRDKGIAGYILILSLLGMIVAALHYGEQVHLALQPPDAVPEPCDATGVSCARTPFFHFGYITIPMMALTAFALNAMGSLIVLRRKA